MKATPPSVQRSVHRRNRQHVRLATRDLGDRLGKGQVAGAVLIHPLLAEAELVGRLVVAVVAAAVAMVVVVVAVVRGWGGGGGAVGERRRNNVSIVKTCCKLSYIK